tara:strand:+ start:875 stop:1534 length:660 start_codon:yes stop_codon:yes gene_type:complete
MSLIPILFFSNGIVSELLWRLVESPWQRISAEKALISDAIVVLSGSRHAAPGDEKIVEWLDPDRFFAGIDLFKKGKAPIIIFTNGKSPFQQNMRGEGEYYQKEAEKLGIPLTAIRNSGTAFNTYQEATQIKKLLNSNNDLNVKQNILLVTSAFHMKRAKKVFEQKGFIVSPFPVDFKSRGKWTGSTLLDPTLWVPNAYYLDSSSAALREIIGRIIYKAF